MEKRLDSILKLKEANGELPGLKRSIFDLTPEQVTKMLETQQDIPLKEKPIGTLREAQTLGVGYMVTAGSCLLADSVGLGKTVQTSAYINFMKAQKAKVSDKPFRYILFAEVKPQQQLQSELIRFTGSPVERIYATKKELSDFIEKYPAGVDAMVAPHSIARNGVFYSYLHQIIEANDGELFDAIILDEGSVIGNHLAQATKGFYRIAELAKNRIVLNATPFERRLLVLYNQLVFVDKAALPGRTKFLEEYTVFDHLEQKQNLHKYKNEDQFYDSIKYMYYGNTRKNLGAKITNSDVQLKTAPLSKIQRYMYKRSQYYNLINDCPTQLDPKVDFNDVNVPKLRMLKEVMAEVPEGEQVLIFSHYKESHKLLTEYLESEGKRTKVLNGTTKKKDVDAYIEGFKKGEIDVLITNIQKSLNFGNCDYVVFYSFSTNPSQLIQMEGRVTRDFHVDNKHFYILMMEGREYKSLVTKTRQTLVSNKEFIEIDESVISKFLLNLVDTEGGKAK